MMVRWDTDDSLHYHRGHCYCNFVCQPLSRSPPLSCGGGHCQWSDPNDGPDRKLIAGWGKVWETKVETISLAQVKVIPGGRLRPGVFRGVGRVMTQMIHEPPDYSALLTAA